MENLNDMYLFVEVVNHGGFAAAGRALGIPKSRLSRRISGLEDRLNVRLLQRTTRKSYLTDVGRAFYEHCRAMVVEASAAEEAIEASRSSPCGTIRMTCPTTLLNVHVGEMLAEFMESYPEVIIHLDATNRRVDLVGEGIDLAIRVRPEPLEDSELILRVLSDRRQCIVARPGLIERPGPPAFPADLLKYPSLARGVPEESFEWILHDRDGRELRQPFYPRLITTDMLALQKAALAGVGIVQLPHLMVENDLASGALMELLPDWTLRREIIHVVYPSRRGMVPSVRALIDHLSDRYASFEED